jgi:zinc and cadmium transporter
MSPVFASLLAAGSVMLVSLTGVIFASKTLGVWMHSRLTYLATFSAGVLSILAYHLIEESLQEAPTGALATGSILAGVIVMELIHHALPHVHHHHEIDVDHPHTPVDGRKVLVSDAVHNVTDGFIIVPAFFVDFTIGIAATAGILLHELVQEVSEFFVLKEAGYPTQRALALNFAASSTILIGVVLALVLASFEATLSLLAGFAAGGFLSVVVRDLLPHAFESIQMHKRWLPHVVAALVGATLMFGVISLVPHEDPDETAHDAAVSMLRA